MMSLKKMFITVVAVAGAITAVNAEQPVNKNVDAAVTQEAPVTQAPEQKKQEPVTQAPVTTEAPAPVTPEAPKDAPKTQEASTPKDEQENDKKSAEEFQEFLKTLEQDAQKEQTDKK